MENLKLVSRMFKAWSDCRDDRLAWAYATIKAESLIVQAGHDLIKDYIRLKYTSLTPLTHYFQW
jgi:endonuclease/exonuclease/phosphatase (EEP) superfamily protein YafD